MVEVGVASCLIKTKDSSFKQYGEVSLPSSVRTTITPVTMDQSPATKELKSLKLSYKFSLLHPLIRSLARTYSYNPLSLFVYQNFSLDGIYVTVNIRHELGLDRFVAASSDIFKKVFQVVVYVVCNSAFLASCCCSFFLHALANLIYIVLVSRQKDYVSISVNF